MWIASKRQTIKRGTGYADLNPGDPIPEAATWVNRTPWINQGFIEEVPDPLTVEVLTDLDLAPPVEEAPSEKEEVITVTKEIPKKRKSRKTRKSRKKKE